MLIYLAFRFEWIYGVAAVVTVFHDTLITLGAFSLTNKPISLTVIAAILTLIGYSNNDTIVVFDRFGGNLRLLGVGKFLTAATAALIKTLSGPFLQLGLHFLLLFSFIFFGVEWWSGSTFA